MIRHLLFLLYASLLFAMTPPASAQPVGSADIKKNAVHSKHIKNGEVKSKDIRNGNVRTKDLANEAVSNTKFVHCNEPLPVWCVQD